MRPAIYSEFDCKECISDGISIYDFLGGKINAAYKNGWQKNVAPQGRVLKPGYPSTSEWTVDWIACLLAAKLAGDRFSVIELGAGYGQWMVSSIMAYKTINPISPAHGMALEAESRHFEWLKLHVDKNLSGYSNIQTDLLFAAAGYDGVVQFPVNRNPDANYGLSYGSTYPDLPMQDVQSLSMQSIDQRFGESEIDLLHVDIQGAEADLMANPGFDEALKKTRVVLFGTHRTDELHLEVKKRVENAGMTIAIEWSRNSTLETLFGEIKTGDGAILAVNPPSVEKALNFMRAHD
jgi:FkbM family methyltransferase